MKYISRVKQLKINKMGQRHQIFLKVPNPRKEIKHDEEIKILNGRKKNVILPFYNGWLFGKGALILALNVLNHTSKVPLANKISSDERTGNLISPFSLRALSGNPYSFSKYINQIECIINYTTRDNPFGGIGFHSTFFEKDDYKTMSERFDMGDNNDGITIIDTINNKYCFMNIFTYPDSFNRPNLNDVRGLPSMTPVDAETYVRAYYPKDVSSTRENEVIEGLIKEFEGFELLTEKELKKDFPKVYEDHRKEA